MPATPLTYTKRLMDIIADIAKQSGDISNLSYKDLRTTYKSSKTHDQGHQNAYIAGRMAATYHAIHWVLGDIQRLSPTMPTTFLDMGSGPGTAYWAACDYWPGLRGTLLERDPVFINIAKKIYQHDDPVWGDVLWENKDYLHDICLPMHDIVCLSYTMGENSDKLNLDFLENIWKITGQYMIIIEPGTPKGFDTIGYIRSTMIDRNDVHILAPCPHNKPCPMKNHDWCHFSVRLPRTKIHKNIKGGSLGFEDEKFSYLVLSRSNNSPSYDRIIKRPRLRSGHVMLDLCTQHGVAQSITLSRKDKASFTTGKNANWGDPL